MPGCVHSYDPGAPQFYIDPEVCIDCEQCEIVCPVDAIFKDIDIPAEHVPSIEVNARLFPQEQSGGRTGTVRYSVGDDSCRPGLRAALRHRSQRGGCRRSRRTHCRGEMDKAEPRSTELAFNKAYTAAALPCADRGVGAAGAPTLAAQFNGFPSRTDDARERRDTDPQWSHHRRRYRRRGREPPGARCSLLPRRYGGVGKPGTSLNLSMFDLPLSSHQGVKSRQLASCQP